MKLLFNENLSQRLVARLADVFPGSSPVGVEGVGGRSDELVGAHAAKQEFAIVSKDEDFHHLAFLRGAPPKAIGVLLAFIDDPGSAYLALRRS